MKNSNSNSYHQLIEYDKQQLILLLDPIVDIHYVNFQQTEIYSKIHDLTDTLNYVEQGMLAKEIRNHFGTFIYNLSKLYPKITPKEIIVCCLWFRFPVKKIALCLGYPYTAPVRKHKSRIRKKLTVMTDRSFLFNFIFGN